jgi:nucleoside-diphosphate-sugar epimerase
MTQKALVLGASGSFGGAMALELLRRGWQVTALVRDRNKLSRIGKDGSGLIIVEGDAQDGDALQRAASGCSLIVHGVNYPYPQWIPHMQAVTGKVLQVARANNLTVVFPGNVYGLGAQTDTPLPETAGMRPNSKKGRLRVQLETALHAATVDGRARVLIVRAGDYFGPTVRNGYVDRLFGAARKGKSMQVLGRLDVPHQWAYVPDLARLSVDLLALPNLQPFEVVHCKGHIVSAQHELLQLIANEAGKPGLHIRRLPWWLLRMVALVDPLMREVMEMRYLFDRAVIIDDPRRRELLPQFTGTPLDQAVRDTLASYPA